MTSMQPADLNAAIAKSLHEHWKLLLIEGIVLLVLGGGSDRHSAARGIGGDDLARLILIIGGAVASTRRCARKACPAMGSRCFRRSWLWSPARCCSGIRCRVS